MDSGNSKEERTSLSELALRPDLPAVRLDDGFRNEESESEPGRIRTIQLPIAFENPLEIRLIDPRSEVSDRDPNELVDYREADKDLSSRRAEFDRVGQQVREDLKDSVVVDSCVEGAGRLAEVQREVLFLGKRAECIDGLPHDFSRVP